MVNTDRSARARGNGALRGSGGARREISERRLGRGGLLTGHGVQGSASDRGVAVRLVHQELMNHHGKVKWVVQFIFSPNAFTSVTC